MIRKMVTVQVFQRDFLDRINPAYSGRLKHQNPSRQSSLKSFTLRLISTFRAPRLIKNHNTFGYKFYMHGRWFFSQFFVFYLYTLLGLWFTGQLKWGLTQICSLETKSCLSCYPVRFFQKTITKYHIKSMQTRETKKCV